MIRIGSRGSKLALIQAGMVQAKIVNLLGIDKSQAPIVTIKTMGDKIQDKNLNEIGGKGLFLKELEEALLTNQVDIAVHSLKDVPAIIPDKLRISAVIDKGDPFDAFLSPIAKSFIDLPQGAVVGTSSPRRAAQILNLRSDIKIVSFRGNIETRIRKLEDKLVDATILAVAGLERIGFDKTKYNKMNCDEMVPAIGAGVICVESREGDKFINKIAKQLNNKIAYKLALCERVFLEGLNANCKTPVGGHAKLEEGNSLSFVGMAAKFDGSEIVKVHTSGRLDDFQKISNQALAQIKESIKGDFFR